MKDDLTRALDVLNYARRAQRHLAGKTYAQFASDELLQDAVIRCCEVMGEAAKCLSPRFRAAHSHINWSGMAGFRDVLIHGYDGVNCRRCWDIIVEEVPPVIAALEKIIPPQTV